MAPPRFSGLLAGLPCFEAQPVFRTDLALTDCAHRHPDSDSQYGNEKENTQGSHVLHRQNAVIVFGIVDDDIGAGGAAG